MRIAITGGSGFIGQATIRAAEKAGHEVWTFDRPNSIMGSLHMLKGAERVIHLAGMLGTAELFADAEYAVDVNVKGTIRVLEWCRENGAGYTGITMPPVFPSVYTATKICADRMATAWHTAYSIPVSRVRAFNAFGPGQKHGPDHPQKILPTFATEAWHDRPIPIWGDGKQTVDLVLAEDVARMLIDASHFGDDKTFDAGTGSNMTVNELAEYVIDVTGSKGGIEWLPMRKGEIPTNICATGEGWSHLGWQPTTTWNDIHKAVMSYKP